MWRSQNVFKEDVLEPSPALIVPSPALIILLQDKFFVNKPRSKEAPKVPINILRNTPLCSLASFSIVSLTPFNNNPESSRDLTIFKISSISSFEIIKIVLLLFALPDLKIFLCIPASAADAAAVNYNGIKTLLANGLITLLIKGNPVFSVGSKSLSRNPPDCIIFDN